MSVYAPPCADGDGWWICSACGATDCGDCETCDEPRCEKICQGCGEHDCDCCCCQTCDQYPCDCATDASTCECGSCVAQRGAELSRWVRWAEWGDPAGSPAQTNGARPDGPAGTQQGGTATMTATGEVTSVADLLGQVDGLNTTLGEGGDQSVADGLAQAARIAEIADGADMHPGTAARDAVHAMSESAATAQDAVSAFLEALSAAVDAVSTGKGD